METTHISQMYTSPTFHSSAEGGTPLTEHRKEVYPHSQAKHSCYSKVVKTLLKNQSCAAGHLGSCYCVTKVKISRSSTGDTIAHF